MHKYITLFMPLGDFFRETHQSSAQHHSRKKSMLDKDRGSEQCRNKTKNKIFYSGEVVDDDDDDGHGQECTSCPFL